MGEPVPLEMPELQPAQMYKVTVARYQVIGGECCKEAGYLGDQNCAKLGAQILAWIAFDTECVEFGGICNPVAGCERIVSIEEI